MPVIEVPVIVDVALDEREQGQPIIVQEPEQRREIGLLYGHPYADPPLLVAGTS